MTFGPRSGGVDQFAGLLRDRVDVDRRRLRRGQLQHFGLGRAEVIERLVVAPGRPLDVRRRNTW